MNAPQLIYKYSVRTRSATRDARGEKSTTYVHKFFVWGESPRQGVVNTGQEGGHLLSESTLRLRTRFVLNIEVGDQLVNSTQPTMYLTSVLDVDGQRRFLQLVASQTPAEGS